MKKGMLVLCLGVASLSLSSCSTSANHAANWNEVKDFLNGMYTTLDGTWEGIHYTYEYEKNYEYSYINPDTHIEIRYINDEIIRTDNCITYYDGAVYQSVDSVDEYLYNDYYSKNEYSSYIGGDGYQYSRDYFEKTGSDSGDTSETSYYYEKYSLNFSTQLSRLESTLDSLITTYTNSSRLSSYFNIISASIGKNAVNWTMYEGENETTTISIKTDSNYVVTYYSTETIQVDSPSSSSTNDYDYLTYVDDRHYIETYEIYNKQALEAPSWVNETNFPPEEEE